jgi:predicted nucleic acid-binding Zn ribbon protein
MRYGFKCNNCRHEWIVIMDYVTYANALYFECPKCCSVNTKRIYDSPPSIHYKGNGFTKKVEDDK